MIELTKRQFVRLAGLSIADRIFPRWLHAESPARSQNKVIIVTFGGGVRYSETFSPEGVRNVPRLLELKPQGFFYRNCVNAGVLSHFNSTASIVTGNWQRVDDFGFQPPASPTLFELYRKQRSARAIDAWTIATNKSFATMGTSSDAGFGERFGGNVVLPKQLLLEAVQSVVRKGSEGGVANRDVVLEHLENILNEGYEGVGWTIFKAGRGLDQRVRAALLHGLVDYINGPEAPTSGDELTFFITREVMREFAPRLGALDLFDNLFIAIAQNYEWRLVDPGIAVDKERARGGEALLAGSRQHAVIRVFVGQRNESRRFQVHSIQTLEVRITIWRAALAEMTIRPRASSVESRRSRA